MKLTRKKNTKMKLTRKKNTRYYNAQHHKKFIASAKNTIYFMLGYV